MAKEKKVNSEEKTNNQRFKNTICYVPLFAIVLFFTDTKKDAEFEQNIKYGILLFVCYIVLLILFWIIPAFYMLIHLLGLVYIVVSIILGLKAYRWDTIKIDFFDNIEAKIKDKK